MNMKRKYELNILRVSLHNLNSKHFRFLYKSRRSIIINHQQYINDNVIYRTARSNTLSKQIEDIKRTQFFISFVCGRQSCFLKPSVHEYVGVACVTWDRTSSYFILSVRHPHDLELCVRALCSSRIKKKEKKAEARRWLFISMMARRMGLAWNESSKEDIYVIGCAISILKSIFKSSWLLHYECATESNRKLYDSILFFFFLVFSYI